MKAFQEMTDAIAGIRGCSPDMSLAMLRIFAFCCVSDLNGAVVGRDYDRGKEAAFTLLRALEELEKCDADRVR
jgi:hypothetical protein